MKTGFLHMLDCYNWHEIHEYKAGDDDEKVLKQGSEAVQLKCLIFI